MADVDVDVDNKALIFYLFHTKQGPQILEREIEIVNQTLLSAQFFVLIPQR